MSMTAPQPMRRSKCNPPPAKRRCVSSRSLRIASIDDVEGRDSYAVTAVADIIDRSLHATIARFTFGLSPAALAKAYFDWATHLAVSPGKRLQLVDKATRKAVRFANYAFRARGAGRQDVRAASSRCRRIGASTAPTGRSRRTISSTRLPAAAAMVAQRDHRRPRRQPSSMKRMVEFVVAPDARHGLAVEFPAHQSRGAAADRRQRRHEPRARRAQFRRGLGARDQRQEAGRHRGISRSAATSRSRPARSSTATA